MQASSKQCWKFVEYRKNIRYLDRVSTALLAINMANNRTVLSFRHQIQYYFSIILSSWFDIDKRINTLIFCCCIYRALSLNINELEKIVISIALLRSTDFVMEIISRNTKIETDNELSKSRSLSYCDLTSCVQGIFNNALANMYY